MTTERELLTLAAKACGFHDYRSVGIHLFEVKSHPTWPWVIWNPLHDDGDCARMEAALGICVDWCYEMVMSCAVTDVEVGEFVNAFEKYADHAGDKNAARRAASVAVAAEIGRLK